MGRTGLYEVMGKIKSCSEDLAIWNKNTFEVVREKITLARQRLRTLQLSDPHG